METLKCIKTRRSIREYTAKDITEKQIKILIDAARHAPSAKNVQDWEFIIIRDNKIQRDLMLNDTKRSHLAEAPVVIAVCFDKSKGYWGLINAALAAQNLMLAAWDMKIGTCWVSSYILNKRRKKAYQEIKRILHLPAKIEVIGLIACGIPNEKPEPKELRSIDEIIHYDIYGGLKYR